MLSPDGAGYIQWILFTHQKEENPATVKTCIELENITLSERNQTEKDKYFWRNNRAEGQVRNSLSHILFSRCLWTMCGVWRCKTNHWINKAPCDTLCPFRVLTEVSGVQSPFSGAIKPRSGERRRVSTGGARLPFCTALSCPPVKLFPGVAEEAESLIGPGEAILVLTLKLRGVWHGIYSG